MRVRFDTARKRNRSVSLSTFSRQQQKCCKIWLFSFLLRHIKFFPIFTDALLSQFSFDEEIFELQKLCGTAMPYCKIFIWFLLLFFIFLAFFSYYLCNSFSAYEENRTKAEVNSLPSSVASPFTDSITSRSDFPTAHTSVCMVFQVNSFQYKLNWLRSRWGWWLCVVCDCDLSWCIIKLIIGFWIWNYEALCCRSFAVLSAISAPFVTELFGDALWCVILIQ